MDSSVAVGRVANLRFATLLLTICLLKCAVADILVYQQDQVIHLEPPWPVINSLNKYTL